jgi:hypothetical protein
MRRNFVLRVAFSPTRLSAEHLREAYEVVTPVSERTIVTTESDEGRRTRPTERSRRGSR